MSNHEVVITTGADPAAIEPPTSAKLTLAGQEYFFEVEYEHVTSATSLRVTRVGLSMRNGISNPEELREEPIDAYKRMEMLTGNLSADGQKVKSN